MSKYYKAENVIRKRAEDLADTSYWEWGNPKNVDEWIEVAEMEFKDLPTIEVSDEQLSKLKSRENSAENTTASEDFTSISRAFHEQGEWIPCAKEGLALTELMRREGKKWYGYRCTNCNFIYKGNALTESRYCQWCGAKMKG